LCSYIYNKIKKKYSAGGAKMHIKNKTLGHEKIMGERG
jgi:hypothetical protein